MNTATLDSRVSTRTTMFLSQDHRLLIDDEWVDAASGKTFPVYNPATGLSWRRSPRPTRKTSIERSAPRDGVRRRSVAEDDRLAARPAAVEAGRPRRAAPRGVRRARVAGQRQAARRRPRRRCAAHRRHVSLHGRMGRRR